MGYSDTFWPQIIFFGNKNRLKFDVYHVKNIESLKVAHVFYSVILINFIDYYSYLYIYLNPQKKEKAN